MAYLVRTVHVASATFILGGAVLLILVFILNRRQRLPEASWQLDLMQAYELGFWTAVGLIVATGVGNLGHFGDALPGSSTDWGRDLIVKLGLVSGLLVYSAVRSFALYVLSGPDVELGDRQLNSLRMLYSGTAVLALGVVGLAEALAHF